MLKTNSKKTEASRFCKEEKKHEYKISVREYNGMYFVEFDSKSLGVTLLVTWDKEQAEDERKRYAALSKQQMLAVLNGK